VKSKLPHHLPLTLGAAIRSRRKDLRLSQEGLGFRSGLHRTYVADLERGARNPSLMSIAKVAKALNVSLSDLFTNIQAEDADLDAVDFKSSGCHSSMMRHGHVSTQTNEK